MHFPSLDQIKESGHLNNSRESFYLAAVVAAFFLLRGIDYRFVPNTRLTTSSQRKSVEISFVDAFRVLCKNILPFLSSLATAGSGHGHHNYSEQKRFCCRSCRRSTVPAAIRTLSIWFSIFPKNETGTGRLRAWRSFSHVIFPSSSAWPDEHASRHAICSNAP